MEFLKSLASRKLILTVAGVIYFAAMGDVNQALILALGYMGVNVAEKVGEPIITKLINK